MADLSWRIEVWSHPLDPDGFRLLDTPPVIEAHTGDRDDAVGAGSITLAADYEHLDQIISVDPTDVGSSKSSLIAFFRPGQTTPDLEFFAEDMTETLRDDNPLVTIKGPDARSGPDDAVVYPRTDTETDWIWGGENVLPDLSLGGLGNINEVWHLYGTDDPFTITVDGDTTDPLSDPTNRELEAALQALDSVTDVTVAGAGEGPEDEEDPDDHGDPLGWLAARAEDREFAWMNEGPR